MDNLLHPPEVRRRNQYSRWLLYDALKCVLRGKMSCHQAAIRYKVPRSTIQRKIHMCREQHRLALELKLQHEIQPSSYVEDIVECPISPETIAGVSPAASNSAELTSLYDCCADEMCSNGVKEEQIPQRFSASNSSNDNDNLVEVCDDEIMIRSVLMTNEEMSSSTVQMKEDLNAGDLSNCDYLPVEHSISAMNRRISVNLESDHDYQPTQSLDQFTEDQIDFCGEEHVIGSFEGHDELRSSSNSNDSMYCSTTNTICDLEDSYSRGCTQDALIPQQTDNCYQLPSTSIAFDSTDICNSDNNSSEYIGADHCKLDNGGNRSVMFYDSDEFGCAQDSNSIITSASVLPMNDIYAGSSLSTLSSSSNADGYHSVAFESAHDDGNDDSSDQAYCTSSGAMFLDTTETGDCTNELMQTAADDRQFFHADGDEFYGGDELVVSDVNGERGFCSQQSDGNDLGGSESFSRDSLVEKLAVDGGLDERISFTDRDEAPPKQRRRRHFIVTKRAFRHGATFSGLRQKVDAEEEELERAADRLSEAFRSVPSRSRLPKYLNRPQEHQSYAAFHNHGSAFAVKSLSQPRVLVPAKCVLVRRHHQPMNDLYLNSVDDGSAVLRTNGVYSASL